MSRKTARTQIQKLARLHGPWLLRRLAEMIEDPRTPVAVRRQCIMDMLAYGYGTPTSVVAMEAAEPPPELPSEVRLVAVYPGDVPQPERVEGLPLLPPMPDDE